MRYKNKSFYNRYLENLRLYPINDHRKQHNPVRVTRTPTLAHAF